MQQQMEMEELKNEVNKLKETKADEEKSKWLENGLKEISQRLEEAENAIQQTQLRK